MTIKLFGRFTILSIDTDDRCTCDYYDDVPQDDREPEYDEEPEGEVEASWVDCHHCKERLVTLQGVLSDEDLDEMLTIHATVCPAQVQQ